MGLVSFFLANWDSVLAVVVFIAGVVVLYRRGEIEFIKDMLFSLVIEAEKDFGDGTGALKKAKVIAEVYKVLPVLVTAVVSKGTVEGLLETVLAEAKKKWTENKVLKAYVSGGKDETVLEEDITVLE